MESNRALSETKRNAYEKVVGTWNVRTFMYEEDFKKFIYYKYKEVAIAKRWPLHLSWKSYLPNACQFRHAMSCQDGKIAERTEACKTIRVVTLLLKRKKEFS